MATDLVVPKLGESITEAVIAKWLKQVGEPIQADEPVVDLETDKVSIALPAPASGVLQEQKFAAGTTVKIGDVIGIIAPGPEVSIKPAADAAPPPPTVKQPTTAPPEKIVSHTAPSSHAASSAPPAPAAPTAASNGGETPHRTLPPSLRKALREGHAVEPQRAHKEEAPHKPAGPREEAVALSPLRKRIAQRLVEAQHTAAILTTFNEVDMSAVMALRARFQDDFTKKHGIKLGFMSFFVKACVEALKEWPGLNAELRGSEVIYKKHYDFGIAVGSGRGLVVPVLRDVDARSMASIEKEIARLAERAKTNQLTLDELSGGTFSITNGGIYGSMMSTPLLNMPQTGILGMHNIIKRPIGVGDEIALRPMMYLALSYDHRVVDGREAVSFVVGIKQRIESPDRLLLEI
jgi:2-oxoglutarate dehydrogenase E2 component (dihydrolipoamide succinyltransferase)